MTRSLVLSLLVVVGGCATAPSPNSSDAAVAVNAAWAAHVGAARAKDVKAACALWADDIVYAVQGMPEVRGRAAIDAMETEGIGSSDIGDDVAHTTQAIVCEDETALELGTVRGTVFPKNAEEAHITFHYIARWKRNTNGEWRIHHLNGLFEKP